MQSTMMDYPLLLTHLLERAHKLFPSREIVSRAPDRSLERTTYAEVARRSWQLAAGLSAAGLKPGDRVATLMWNHSVHLEAYLGIPAAGGVTHTLNPRLSPEDLAYIVNHAEDRFLIVDQSLLPVLQSFQDQVHLDAIYIHGTPGSRYEPYADYEQLLSPHKFTPPPLSENQAAAMCYTSGTTGKPKGVVYSHRALVLHTLVESLPLALGASMSDALMPVVPMFHVNAWGIPFAALASGCKLVFPGPHLDPKSLLELMSEEGVSLAAGVPTVWFGVLDLLESNPTSYALKPGTRIVIGGAAAPISTIERAERLGLEVIQAWGMTELTPIGTVSRLKPELEQLPEPERNRVRTTQGLPVPWIEVRIQGTGDEPLPWDGQTAGELAVRGPWVTGSYYKNPEAGDRFTPDGWFLTGDLATIDPEGYVRLVDRVKDLVKSGGEWISSVELENALMGHPGVKEAAVIAIPHPKWQERPIAVVVPRDGSQLSEDQLREFLAASFPKWWLPDAFVFIEAIPRSAAGKFLKRELRDRYSQWHWEDDS